MSRPGTAYWVIASLFLAVSIRNLWTISRGVNDRLLEDRIGHTLFGRAYLRARPTTAVVAVLFFLGCLLVEIMTPVITIVFMVSVVLGLATNLLVLFFNVPQFLIPRERRNEESLAGYFWRRVVLGNRRP